MKPANDLVARYVNSSWMNVPQSLAWIESQKARFQKLNTTSMPTISRLSAMIEQSSSRADHFSSERKYGLARRQASLRTGRVACIIIQVSSRAESPLGIGRSVGDASRLRSARNSAGC